MFSATAIADFLACRHLTTLNRAWAEGEIEKPFFADPGLELLKELGLAHEHAYLHYLAEDRGLQISKISDDISWNEAAAQTVAAIRGGAEVIYQATFLGEQWRGRADFLIRVDKPSDLGAWSYEVVETKLARSTKARATIQLSFYSDLLAAIQGVEPDYMHVVLGGGAQPEKFSVQRYLAYFRKARRDFEAGYRARGETYPEPVELCRVCDWASVCDRRWHDDDHLSLVAGITRNQRKALAERDVNTVAQLASLTLPVSPKIERIAEAPLRRIREQARVQVQGRAEGRPVHEFLEPVEADKGLAMLPLPSRGDLFLDFEGDPFAFEQGLEYLIGTVTVSENGAPVYETIWSFDRAGEKRAFQTFIDGIQKRRSVYPDLHIYHYAPYEPTAIKHLAGRHGICADDVDDLLRAGVFVDLYRVVRQGLRASVESYSIKKLERFYGYRRSVPLRDATSALQAFETILALGGGPEDSREILRTIEEYNRDDCLSAWRLREWLEDLRLELEERTGIPIVRPALKSGEPSEGLAAHITEVSLVKERLVADLPEEDTEWTSEQRSQWLLAQLLEWHRREDKSAWWEYYRLCDLSDDELLEDKSALGGLVYLGEAGRPKKSIVHRYSFPPQDHSIDRAHDVHDPRTRKSAGTVDNIEERNCIIDLKRGKTSSVPHPTALVPCDVMDCKVLESSLLRLGKWVADHGIEGRGLFQAARDILLRASPRLSGGATIESIAGDLGAVDAAIRLALSLDASALPIQGPPGSGKTYTAAQMIVALVRDGRRVGVTAVSHKVISNLLNRLCQVAEESGVGLSVVQKSNDNDGCDDSVVAQVESNEAVLDKLSAGEAQVAAGTVWLWGRPEMADAVDVLFVDEAGQMSLANVLAASQAAKSIVLLGDPQQLDQPQRGVHPPGAEASALSHLLNGRTTIGDDQGLFLAESWRLHPDVCRFTSEVFYDGRLLSRPENARQRLNAPGPLDDTGLRFAPVDHSGNQSESPEEVDRVAELVEGLLDGTTWTDKKGKTALLLLKDILIVVPYNAQVSALAQRLPPEARVGTVDKFQGQEAPVVIYSMTTSTPEDAPRGMEFLYSSNRLNVATSRAQCVTVLVANPGLFDVQCRTPRQIELANAFCRYLEMAQLILGRT
jgi:uncharacterized protein